MLPNLDIAERDTPIVTLSEYNDGETHVRGTYQVFMNKIANLNIKEKQLKYTGVEAFYREIDIDKPAILKVVHPTGFLKLQFELVGHSDFSPDSNAPSSIPVLIPGGHYNGIYMPHIAGELRYPRSRKCLDVMVTPEYLRGVLGNQEGVISQFLSRVSRQRPCLLHERAQNITAAMRRCIYEIGCPTVVDHLKPVFIPNKIAELILLVADDVSRKSDYHPYPVPTMLDDFGNVMQLKRWIDQHITEPITLSQLAGLAGICQTKLKMVFKSGVGLPVMTYVRQQKLAYAYRMLIAKQHTVSEVAAMVNYQHAQHFTTAFKRMFRQLPSEIMKKHA
ncbi:helix-turn-helix domain-containing protein [Parapedobacter pyrenivorans]|uniref:helix-turn-helix domain-containing protein n=1 Tax=Parapedobacter pyrenivorans TaxID=1305674 RepID=UPI0033426A70